MAFRQGAPGAAHGQPKNAAPSDRTCAQTRLPNRGPPGGFNVQPVEKPVLSEAMRSRTDRQSKIRIGESRRRDSNP